MTGAVLCLVVIALRNVNFMNLKFSGSKVFPTARVKFKSNNVYRARFALLISDSNGIRKFLWKNNSEVFGNHYHVDVPFARDFQGLLINLYE